MDRGVLRSRHVAAALAQQGQSKGGFDLGKVELELTELGGLAWGAWLAESWRAGLRRTESCVLTQIDVESGGCRETRSPSPQILPEYTCGPKGHEYRYERNAILADRL